MYAIATINNTERAMASRHLSIDYIEINVTDIEVAKDFYRQAFGWAFTDYGPGYCGIQGESKEMGGFNLVDVVRGGGPLVVIYSDQIEETYEAVKSAGGTIVTETFEFPGGKRFQFSDPSGNELAVWTTLGHE